MITWGGGGRRAVLSAERAAANSERAATRRPSAAHHRSKEVGHVAADAHCGGAESVSGQRACARAPPGCCSLCAMSLLRPSSFSGIEVSRSRRSMSRLSSSSCDDRRGDQKVYTPPHAGRVRTCASSKKFASENTNLRIRPPSPEDRPFGLERSASTPASRFTPPRPIVARRGEAPDWRVICFRENLC